MSTRTTDLAALWLAIAEAGGIDNYVQNQLVEHGFLVERRETDTMSKAELKRYKAQLKREAAERRELRKAAWAAYRETHIVHLGDGVYYNDAATMDRWDLDEPEARAAANELPRLDGPDDLAKELGITVAQLRWLAVHRDAATRIHYTRFTIPKRDGSERAIWAPLPRLKAAQRWILRNVVEHLPVHGAAHGFLAGRSVVTNAAAHVGSKLIVNIDLKDFFPTITWRRARGMFRKAGYREQVATLLAMICTEAPREVVEWEGQSYFVALGPRCLPQGAPTSPAITNTICLRLDRRLSGLARRFGYTYTRYADDLTFSLPLAHTGEPRVGALIGAVGHIVRAEGFQVHPSKTRVQHTGRRQQVTGLVVNGREQPRVPRSLKRQLRAAVYNLRRGRPLPAGERFERLIGYAAWIHQAEPELGSELLAALGGLNPTA
ncbi:MAG: reverse transcriptase family protein [Myxococcales bacterium]|nr:reverse transcriptase family protein [Myxococcales bacterium]